MRKSLPNRCLALFAAFALGACSASTTGPATSAARPQTAPAANNIVIDNFTFSPRTLTVAVGTKVTWINRDDVPHTVTSDKEPRVLNSPVLDTDGIFEFTFKDAGTFNYYCTVHPHMTASIVVTDK